MRQINKPANDPDPLRIFKQLQTGAGLTPVYSDFKNPEKAQYMLNLLVEQGFLCAYCNVELNLDVEISALRESIRIGVVSIEHWFPKHLCIGAFQYKALEHTNLVAVCRGITDAFTHCDEKRGNLNTIHQGLTINPVYLNGLSCEELINFENGEIKPIAGDRNVDRDLNTTLNLNCQPLVIRRRNVEQGYIDYLQTRVGEGYVDIENVDHVKALIDEAYSISNGHYSEDTMVIVCFLKKLL